MNPRFTLRFQSIFGLAWPHLVWTEPKDGVWNASGGLSIGLGRAQLQDFRSAQYGTPGPDHRGLDLRVADIANESCFRPGLYSRGGFELHLLQRIWRRPLRTRLPCGGTPVTIEACDRPIHNGYDLYCVLSLAALAQAPLSRSGREPRRIASELLRRVEPHDFTEMGIHY